MPPKGLTLPLPLAKCRSTGMIACSSSSFAKKSSPQPSHTKFSTISSGVFPCTSSIALAKAATRSPLNSLVPSTRCDIEGGDKGDELLKLAATNEEEELPDEQEATDGQEDLGEQEPEEHEGVRTGGAHE